MRPRAPPVVRGAVLLACAVGGGGTAVPANDVVVSGAATEKAPSGAGRRRRTTTTRPAGLLTDLRPGPSLGARSRPVLSWIVPPCRGGGPDHAQVGYEIFVRALDDAGGDGEGWSWESGYVSGNSSSNVEYGGQDLEGGTRYAWNVTTYTQATPDLVGASDAAETGKDSDDRRCKSDPSDPSVFVTALSAATRGAAVDTDAGGYGWSPSARFISLRSSPTSTFAYLRTEVTIRPEGGVASALLFVAAPVDPVLLCGYKAYVDGNVVDVGPGRDEAPLWDGDGRARALPYATVDLTESPLSSPGRHALALQVIQVMQRRGPKLTDGPARVMAQLLIRYRNGTSSIIVTDDSGAWMSLSGDAHRRPGPPIGKERSAGTNFVEFVDARAEPMGWRLPGYDDADWEAPLATAPTNAELGELHPKMQPPMLVAPRMDVERIWPTKVNGTVPPVPTHFTADFGREFQGGLRLEVHNGTTGQVVRLSCGEALEVDEKGGDEHVTYSWGWEFDWTLRDGKQLIEQHKYMECRYVSLAFLGEGATNKQPPPAGFNFTLSAWTVKYPWYPDDTAFSSSDPLLNSVWELSRYTLEAGVVDTFTDGNTRERRPYEADGLVASASRSLLQRDYMWHRKSADYVVRNPTWPVEWRQVSAHLAWLDYVATGRADLALAHLAVAYGRTMIGSRDDKTGLLNSTAAGKRHIIDWKPYANEGDVTKELGEFTGGSDFMSVTNMLGASGLELLSRTLAGADSDRAKELATEAAGLRAAMTEHMWNGTAYCDGRCSDVDGASLVMTNMYALALGFVPPEHVETAWGVLSSWGLEKMGAYGAFWYQAAAASSYLAAGGGGGLGGHVAPPDDDGTGMLTALTKCDEYSWCSGLRDDGLTMTRESFHAGTYSHLWGASPVAGVVWGILGLHPTSPGYGTFVVRPRLGDLEHISVLVPTMGGYIGVTATRDAVEVSVPCNTLATICMPRFAGDKERFRSISARSVTEGRRLLLDEAKVEMELTDGGHMCTTSMIGCGAEGAPRRLSLLNQEAASEA